uniref:uncharacterized protein LOC101306718 n=1 Tax=Fragaria vesca subsp. vesca TaxID=101020 RepID=UPI0005CA3F76|nr:PREDICTED: uncharacterized protein LOC101306718 [Fragaria vesca subsp. vesca]XP_011462917.1 PREDICTED: uncharacterized protein LOC101306718 [Fragaria vesca subsp. vesca]XP_011462918.1 PREDICTED: uncharacterized protein LOC101306718 [Fragaria vesca subsp. vesca]
MAKGLIKGLKAEEIVRRTGKNIEVKYVDSVHGPQTKELNSLLTKDIGRVIRNSVAMNQPTWWELKEEERLKLCTALSICYEIEYDQKMYDWLMKVVNKTYTSWKAKLTSFLSITKGKRLRKSLCKEEGWMSGIGLSNTSCHLSFRNSQLQTRQTETN